MIAEPNSKLDQIKADLASPEGATRSRAVQELLQWVQYDRAVHADALPIFQQVVHGELEPWTAAYAARGIECVAGADAARPAWRDLLNRPDAMFVRVIALSVADPSYAPVLFELLQRRPEMSIHTGVITTLGRMRDPASFAVLVEHLAIQEALPDAIDALGDFLDPRAIPLLQPHVADDRDSGKVDERGYRLRVGDLAAAAIRRLSRPAEQLEHERRTFAYVPPVVPSNSPPRLPPSIPKSTRSRPNFVAYVPLVCLIVEIPWFGIVAFQQLFRTGNFNLTPAQTHQLDFVAAIPSMAGLMIGFVMLFRPLRLTERICLFAGLLACAVFAFCLGWEFFH